MKGNEEKIIVGLDIGTTNILAVVGKQHNHTLQILGIGHTPSEGVTTGIIANIDKTATAIHQAIQEAEKTSGIHIQVVHTGIADQHIHTHIHRGSLTRQAVEEEITVQDIHQLSSDMYKTIVPPGKKIIHVLPQNYTVDYEDNIKDPVGIAGVKLEADFHLLTASIYSLNNLKKAIQKTKLNIDNIVYSPLATSLSVLNAEEKKAGVCLIDIGGGTTKVTIIHENIIKYNDILPFGGNILTQDIQNICQVMEEQAEILKRNFGNVALAKQDLQKGILIPGMRNRNPKKLLLYNLTQILLARMEEMILYLYQSITKSGWHQHLAGGIVLTGGSAQLQNLTALFEAITGIDTRIGYPTEYIDQNTYDHTLVTPSYATCIGLLLSEYKSWDYRQEYYQKIGHKTSEYTNPYTHKKNTTPLLKKFIYKTKRFLIDD